MNAAILILAGGFVALAAWTVGGLAGDFLCRAWEQHQKTIFKKNVARAALARVNSVRDDHQPC